MPAAISSFDDVHAWLIRGFVEAGLPDHTGGGVAWREDGALNIENLFADQGAGGLLLELAGADGEENAYTVKVVRDAGGARVVARCADTLFRQEWAVEDPATLAAEVLARVRHHHAAFVKWRAEGGETTFGERAAIADDRGAACDRGLVLFLDGLRKQGKALAGGPKAGWWVTSKAAAGGQIAAGLGQDPQYRLRPEQRTVDLPEYREHVERLGTVGLVMIANGGVGALLTCLGLSFNFYALYELGFSGMLGNFGYAALAVVGSGVFAVLQIAGGVAMRRTRWLWLAKLGAWSGIFPCCVGACFLTGLPVGIWALLTLRDERTDLVFS
ncbi:MAG: hypothetical protein ACOZNI_30900 [Myxococcota bacterium]